MDLGLGSLGEIEGEALGVARGAARHGRVFVHDDAAGGQTFCAGGEEIVSQEFEHGAGAGLNVELDAAGLEAD